MVIVQKSALTPSVTAQLVELSQRWVEENCSHGMVANTPEDLKEPLYIATDGGRIVGYAFGHVYTQKKRTSYIEPGSRCFDLDELYVLPEYRSQGVGRELFARLRDEAALAADYLTLATSTKDYKRVLHFYVDELGMDFHNAFLIRRLQYNGLEKE